MPSKYETCNICKKLFNFGEEFLKQQHGSYDSCFSYGFIHNFCEITRLKKIEMDKL